MIEKEFIILIQNIIHFEEFRKMKNYKHHVKGSVYNHWVKVAYLCYWHHKHFHMKCNLQEFVKGSRSQR